MCFQQRAISQGLSGSGLSGENGKLAVIGREVWNTLSYWSINSSTGDVTRQAKYLSYWSINSFTGDVTRQAKSLSNQSINSSTGDVTRQDKSPSH